MDAIPPPPEDSTAAADVEALMKTSLEHYHRHRYAEAKSLLHRALEKARDLGDKLLYARVAGNLANACKELSDFDSSINLYEEAQECFAALGDRMRQGIILFNAAYTYKLIGRWKDVRRVMEVLLSMNGDLSQEDKVKAEALIAEATKQIDLQKHNADLVSLRQSLVKGIELAQARHNAEAITCLGKVYAESEALGFVEIQACALTQIARVHVEQGQKETALEELNRAAALHRSGKDRKGEHETLGNLAAVLISTQQPEQAIAVLEQKIALTSDPSLRSGLVTRITSMRAELSRVKEGSSGVQLILPVAASFIESVGKMHRSNLEMQLQRAELDAKRERELMQLCFKDIPFADVTSRADQACQTLDQLIPLLRTVAEGEDQCSKALRAGVQSGIAASFFGGNTSKANFTEPGTLGRALSRLRNDVQSTAENRKGLAMKLQDDIVGPLSEHKASLNLAAKRLIQRANKASTTFQKAARRVELAQQQKAKMKENVAKLRAQLGGDSGDTTNGGSSMPGKAKAGPSSIIGTTGNVVTSSADAKTQAKIVAKLSKLLETREDINDHLKHCQENLDVAQRRYKAEIARIADDYQRAELLRLEILKQNLLDTYRLQLTANQRRQQQLLNMIEDIESIDPISDVRLYTHNKSVAKLLKDERKKSSTARALRSGSGGRNDIFDEGATEMLPTHAKCMSLLSDAIQVLFKDSTERGEASRNDSGGSALTDSVGDSQTKNVGEQDPNLEADDNCGEEDVEQAQGLLAGKSSGERLSTLEDIASRLLEFKRLFEDEENRSTFVKLLNMQRSKEQDVGIGYDMLASLMQLALDWCAKQSDVRVAKMIMIMSETFFRMRSNNLLSDRAESRQYLQSHIKAHPIWHNQHFWEEAFFMSCREEVVKQMAQAGNGAGKVSSNFPHIYGNICFGQMGSYALNMVNFGVSIKMTRGFIKKMCDVNNIDKEKREMLIENANGLHASARITEDAGEAAGPAASAPGPRFSSPTNSNGKRSPSTSMVSSSEEDIF